MNIEDTLGSYYFNLAWFYHVVLSRRLGVVNQSVFFEYLDGKTKDKKDTSYCLSGKKPYYYKDAGVNRLVVVINDIAEEGNHTYEDIHKACELTLKMVSYNDGRLFVIEDKEKKDELVNKLMKALKDGIEEGLVNALAFAFKIAINQSGKPLSDEKDKFQVNEKTKKSVIDELDKYQLPKFMEIPDVVNKRLSQAKRILKENHLSYSITYTDSKDIKPSSVISTIPPAGCFVYEKAKITLNISKNDRRREIILLYFLYVILLGFIILVQMNPDLAKRHWYFSVNTAGVENVSSDYIGKTIAIKSSESSKYLTLQEIQETGTYELVATSDEIGEKEKFVVVKATNDTIAFKTYNGHYLEVVDHDYYTIETTSDSDNPCLTKRQQFVIINKKNDRYGIDYSFIKFSEAGKYLRVNLENKKQPVRADSYRVNVGYPDKREAFVIEVIE